MNDVRVIRPEEAISVDTHMKYKVYENNPNIAGPYSFIVNDIKCLCDSIGFKYTKIIEIFYIHVSNEDRGNNYGNNMLAQFLMEENVLNENAIVVMKAAPLIFEYAEEPKEPEYSNELIRQATYIESNLAMRSIQSLCGFEMGIPYIYPTPQIKDVLAKIIKDEVICPKNRLGANMIPDYNNQSTKEIADKAIENIDSVITEVKKLIKIIDGDKENEVLERNS